MAEKIEHLAQVILNNWQGKATETEKNELQQWLDSSPGNNAWFNQFENINWVVAEFEKYHSIDLEGNWQKLWLRIAATENKTGIDQKPETRPRSNSFNKGMKWAAVFIGVAAGIIYMLSNSTRQQSHEAFVKRDTIQTTVSDSGNIVLLLADGSRHVVMQEQKDQTVSVNYGVYIKDHKLVFNQSVHRNKTLKSSYHKLIIPKGGLYQLTLPDSSNVWLNSESSIVFPALDTGKTRNVTITGEAYLEVKKDSTRPFYVNLPGGISIEVLGTTFTVNTYPDEPFIGMTLISGEVIVKRAEQEERIKPGQQAQIFESAIKIKDSINIQRYTAWKNGKFYFKRDSLTTVVRQLARWYNKQVCYIDTPKLIVTYIDERSYSIDMTLGGLKDGNSKINITLSKNKDTLIVNK